MIGAWIGFILFSLLTIASFVVTLRIITLIWSHSKTGAVVNGAAAVLAGGAVTYHWWHTWLPLDAIVVIAIGMLTAMFVAWLCFVITSALRT